MSIKNINNNKIRDDQLDSISGGFNQSQVPSYLTWEHYQNQEVEIVHYTSYQSASSTTGFVRKKGYYFEDGYYAAVYVECEYTPKYSGWFPDHELFNAQSAEMFNYEKRVTAAVTEVPW